jgi:signal transduction histidine kinase
LILDISILGHLFSGSFGVYSLTPICFILVSISLILIKSFVNTGYLKILGILSAFIVLVLALFSLDEIIFDSNNYSHLFSFESEKYGGAKGQRTHFMAPFTALCFVLSSLAILTLDKKSHYKWFPSELLALLIGLVAMTTLISYLYGIEPFYVVLKHFPMAIYTAIGFLLIAASILFSNKNKGFFIAELVGLSIGSEIARKLLPAAVLLPIMLGFIRLYLRHNGFVSEELGLGILVLSNMSGFVLIIWFYALKLNKKEVLIKTADKTANEISRKLELSTRFGNAGLWTYDFNSRNFTGDEQMYKMYGLTPDIFDGDYETWRRTIHRDDAKRVHNGIQKCVESGEEFNSVFRIVKPDLVIKTIEVNARIGRDKTGEAIDFFGICYDVTSRKRLEDHAKQSLLERRETRGELKRKLEELKKTNSELDRFVYSASHDLRSPLKSLLGLSNMIIDDVSSENTVQLEQLGMMQSSIMKLDDFIEDILDYSRNSREEVIRKAVDFKLTIDEIMKNLTYMDGADKIDLTIDIDQQMEFISDRARVNMVFSNLISNAIKYKDSSKENVYLAINIKCSNEFAIISIEDNGIGIDERNLDRIFDMFYRATSKSSGSGLGLYIAKEAIEKLNGTIEIESELSRGTKFSIAIPNLLQLIKLE